MKKYYVAGARNAWDTVPVGLFNSYEEAATQFRRGITSNEKGRDLLWSYMAHWFKGEYLRNQKKNRLTPIN